MPEKKQRQKIIVSGIVQGVGFRPFVHNLARRLDLTGLVTNTSDGVTIEVEGRSEALAGFLKALTEEAPPLARIAGLAVSDMPVRSDQCFVIAESQASGNPTTLIPPDVATCDDCLAEFFNPADRRYLYPFINCTNCGPRYTIIETLPYDRKHTTMRSFTMCTACLDEYQDSTNRRYHAEPNACPDCGPQLSMHDNKGVFIAPELKAAEETVSLLSRGRIAAVKGLGGFHLAVDATNDEAVKRLRLRKGRAEKPLAVMVPDIDTAKTLCRLDPEEERILLSRQRPILLALAKSDNGLARAVAPGIKLIGIMLPYTPLHHLLFKLGKLKALVMTSGNLSEEPIAIANQEAVERLEAIADCFLLNNRDIHLRNDDSVVTRAAFRLRFVRRSRGYAPGPISVSAGGPTVLAVGGEIKNTVCLLVAGNAIVSQHIGDLENLAAYQSFSAIIDQLLTTYKAKPELIVRDLHPGYLSTRWAGEQGAPVLAVQHHHAHLAACLAENQEAGPAIGIILDGTGYGLDGSIWGGEILIGDCKGFTRYGHLESMPLPGGETAIRKPWRTAVGYLYVAYEGKLPDLPFLVGQNVDPVVEMLSRNINCPSTTSCGRLFDAVAAMSGVRSQISYEAQAAIELSELADDIAATPYRFDFSQTGSSIVLGVRSLIKAVADDLRAGASQAIVSRRFHQTLVFMFTEAAVKARKDTGLNLVALSGGVFQNRFLLAGLLNSLCRSDFKVLTHTMLPTNDGCISFGQAVIGREDRSIS